MVRISRSLPLVLVLVGACVAAAGEPPTLRALVGEAEY